MIVLKYMIIQKNGSIVMSKGIFVKKINSLFSYNIINENDAELTADRNQFINDETYSILYSLTHIENPVFIKELLSKIIDSYEHEKNTMNLPCEYNVYSQLDRLIFKEQDDDSIGFNNKYIALMWKNAFYEIYEDEIKKKGLKGVVIKTDYKVPENFKYIFEQYKVISLPKEWTNTLINAGVKADKDIDLEAIKSQTNDENCYDNNNYKIAGIQNESDLTTSMCLMEKSIIDNGVAKNVRFSKVKNAVKHLYCNFIKYEKKSVKKDVTNLKYKEVGELVNGI